MLYVIPLCSYVCSQAMSLFAEKKMIWWPGFLFNYTKPFYTPKLQEPFFFKFTPNLISSMKFKIKQSRVNTLCIVYS